MAENTVTSDDAEEFIEFLVEFGGTAIVDPKSGEIRDHKGEPIHISTAGGDLPMIVYREVSKTRNHLVLNPFTDNLVDNAQVEWFYSRKSMELAVVLQMVMEAAIEFHSAKKDTDDPDQFVKLEISSILKGDAKTLADFQKIQADDLLVIYYSTKQKTAQLQTKIFDDDYIKTLDIKAKHLASFQKAFLHIFKCDTEAEFNSEYKYTSSLLTIPNAEAQLRVLYMGHKRLDKFYRAFFPELGTVNLDMFQKHIPNLHKYYGITAWANSSAPQKKEPVVETSKTQSTFANVSTSNLIPTSPVVNVSLGGSKFDNARSIIDHQRQAMGFVSTGLGIPASPYSINPNINQGYIVR